MHNNNPADDHTAAAPYGGAARPAPDKGAGTQDQQRRCNLHVCADLHQSCVAAPPHLRVGGPPLSVVLAP